VKVNFIRRTEVGTWTYEYSSLLEKTLNDLGIDVVGYLPEAKKFRPCDVWFLQGDTDYEFLKFIKLAKSNGEKIVGHHHGGPELLGYFDHKEQKDFYDTFRLNLNKFDIIMFNTKWSRDKFIEFYKPNITDLTRLVTVGFPIDKGRFESKDKKWIVVPGRLANDRQPMLAGIILKPWKDKTIFSAGINPGKDPLEAEYVNTLKQMGFSVRNLYGKDYDLLLGETKIVFSASLRDTLNVSIFEGVLAGAIPVIPNVEPFKKIYSRFRYEAYSVEHARACIEQALRFVDTTSIFISEYTDHIKIIKSMVKLLS